MQLSEMLVVFASLVASAIALEAVHQQPLSSSDKQAVGEALTKALHAMQGHAGGSKYEACADMFPGGKPPADQNSATWVACRNQFYSYAAASLLGTQASQGKGKRTSLIGQSSALNGPLSSSDKQAVGEALTKAMHALQGHGSGSKWEACADMFPNGQPPADQSSATWQACKSQFYAYAAASLVQQPISSSDKKAVGEALTKALRAMQGHGGGSKYEACASMFPNGQPPSDRNSPTWLSCKDQFYASLVGTKSVVKQSQEPQGAYNPHKGMPHYHQSSAAHALPWVASALFLAISL